MIDQEVTFGENIPIPGSSEWIDLGAIIGPAIESDSYGKGNPIAVLVTGSNLVNDASEHCCIVVDGRYSETPAPGPDLRIYVGPHALADQGVIFYLASNSSPSIKLSLEGFLSGEFSAYIIIKE